MHILDDCILDKPLAVWPVFERASDIKRVNVETEHGIIGITIM